MLLCFDYDGVIADSLSEQLRVCQLAQAKLNCGRRPTREDFATVRDLSYAGMAELLQIPVRDWETAAKTLLATELKESDLFAGIAGVLSRLASKHELCIITSSLKEVIQKVLLREKLDGRIRHIADGAEPGTKADKIAAAAARFQIPLSDTFMIGDTRGDIRQGKLAGCNTIAVLWGFQNEETLSLEAPDYIARTPADLLDMLG